MGLLRLGGGLAEVMRDRGAGGWPERPLAVLVRAAVDGFRYPGKQLEDTLGATQDFDFQVR